MKIEKAQTTIEEKMMSEREKICKRRKTRDGWMMKKGRSGKLE